MSENLSEGFDLDIVSSEQAGDVIYELGGGITTVPAAESKDEQMGNTKNDSSKHAGNEKEEAVRKSEEFKKEGNELFKNRNYLDAIDSYTDAIDHCPGMKGDEMIKLQKDHEEQEREKAAQRYNRDSRRRVQKLDRKGNEMESVDKTEEDNDDSLEPKTFVPPIHDYGEYLSVYYSNRAACYIQLGSYQEAISDCDVATLVQPNYGE
jgi:tetratricopeptide (TPR) repeat protein